MAGRQGSESQYTPDLCEKVIEAFEDGNSIVAACLKLDISRDTYYNYKEQFPDFKAAAAKGEAKSQAYWEKLGKSGIIGEIDKFSTAGWQFVLKNRFRKDYGDTPPEKSLSDTLIEKLLLDKINQLDKK